MSLKTQGLILRTVDLEPLLDQQLTDVSFTKNIYRNDLLQTYIEEGLKLKKIPFKIKKEESINKLESKQFISQTK